MNLPEELSAEADVPGDATRSPWRLFEDGRPAGVPHALHEDIRNFGGGTYSHWKDTLYFSTSDNTDPNVNGRFYQLQPEDVAAYRARPPLADAAPQQAPIAAPRPASNIDIDRLADILRRREVRDLAYFHADHFEPWSSRTPEQRWRGLERFASLTKRSAFGRRLSLFYTPLLVHALGEQGRDGDYRLDGDPVVFRKRSAEFLANCRSYVRPLESEIGHEFHIHVHHEHWTRTAVGQREVAEWAREHSTAEADSRRLDFFVGLCREVMREEIGRSFDSWGFVHGNWSLNASDLKSCRIEDEIALLMRQGCYGDFTFPAGEPACDPMILETPYTCLPISGIKPYDRTEADPRPLAPGGGVMAPERFLIWNSPIKATHSSLDYFSEDNRRLFREPPALVEVWLEQSVVLDGRLYLKTHAHSLNYKYAPWQEDAHIPHSYPDILQVFELLQRVGDAAQVPIALLSVDEVMRDLRRFDSDGRIPRGEIKRRGSPPPAPCATATPTAASELELAKSALAEGIHEIATTAGERIDSYYRSRIERNIVLETYESAFIEYARTELPAAEFRIFEVGIGWGMLSLCLAALGYEVVGFVCQHDHAEAARRLHAKLARAMPERAGNLVVVEAVFPQALRTEMLSGDKRNVMLCTNLVHSFSAENQQLILDAGARFEKVAIETGTFGISRDAAERRQLRENLERRFVVEAAIWNDRLLVMRPRPTPAAAEAAISVPPANRPAGERSGTQTENEIAMAVYPLRGPFTSNGGLSWIAHLPIEFQDDADVREAPRRSAWRLLEGGKPIGTPHSAHSDIRELGGGQYSHWGVQLYFSTSDYTDPNVNGREYALRWEGPGAKQWLSALASLPAAEGPAFGPRADVDRCAGLIAIFGASFSGTTLMNAVLGAHPSIFGGGELHWLVQNPSETVCAICRSACRFWTPQARAAITLDNIYHQTSRLFGRPYVVDISKMRQWYQKVLPLFPDLPVARVLLVKHPVRHVSSFLEKKETAGRLPDGSPAYDTWDRVLQRLRSFYEGFALPGETDVEIKYNPVETPTPIDFVLRYEDFVASPAAALAPVLGKLGLEYDPRMETWAQAEHHFIGGNIGPRTQINNDVPALATAAKKYRQRGIFLDNSYSDILDLPTIEKVLCDPDGRWIRERFGYEIARGARAPSRPAVAVDDKPAETPTSIALAGPFTHDGGYCWWIELPDKLAMEADDPGKNFRSPWRLAEDGKPIGMAHASHQDIRTTGGGRHSHWKELLYFSASDNSDPNRNGRRYALYRERGAVPPSAAASVFAAPSAPPAPAALAHSSVGRLADILRRRGVRQVAYFHTDHFEPWGESVETGLRSLERFAELSRQSRYGQRLSLFYTPPIHYRLAPGEGTADGYRVPGDGIVFDKGSPAETERYQAAIAPICEIGHEFHLHIHHTRWTRTTGNPNASLLAWLEHHSTPAADSARLDLFIRLACEAIAKETGRLFARWAFVHGLWALNACDPEGCMVEDEMQLLMRHGCFGDFTFPAGRGHCDPTICEAPYTCLPVAGVKAYDLPMADPRPVERGGGHLTGERFFVWNSPIKAKHSSLDYYWEPNLTLFEEKEALVETWLDRSVLLDEVLYLKTHSHSLDSNYRLADGSGVNPHMHPKVISLFELLERVCDSARLPLNFLTVNEVMRTLRRLDAADRPAASADGRGYALPSNVEVAE